MYLMADFARRVGSKDKKKRKNANLFTSTLVGGGLMYGGYKLDEPGIRLPDKKPKFNRTTSGDPGLDLTFDNSSESIWSTDTIFISFLFKKESDNTFFILFHSGRVALHGPQPSI